MKRLPLVVLGTLLLAAAFFTGGALVSRTSQAAPPVAHAPSDAAEAETALRMKRVADAARNAYEDALGRYVAGSATVEEVALWSRRTWEGDPDRASAASTTAFVDRNHRLEREALKRFGAGHAPKSDTLAAAFFRADAEAVEVRAPLPDAAAAPGPDPTAYR